MCELYAVTSKDTVDISSICKMFFTHSVTHSDGWGFACWKKDTCIVYHGSERAIDSSTLYKRLETPLICQTALVHIRRATLVPAAIQNCHPFVSIDQSGRTWTLIHNGTVNGIERARHACANCQNITDTEMMLCVFLNRLNDEMRVKGRPLTFQERTLELECLIMEMADHNKLNLVLYDGEFLFVHTNMRDTLYILEEKNRCSFMTLPYYREEECKPLPLNQLLVYQKGKLMYTGHRHSNEYFSWMVPALPSATI